MSLRTRAIDVCRPVCEPGHGSNDERDPENVLPGTSTPSSAARATRSTPKKVVSFVVTASQSDEECTLTGTPSGSATNEEGASC